MLVLQGHSLLHRLATRRIYTHYLVGQFLQDIIAYTDFNAQNMYSKSGLPFLQDMVFYTNFNAQKYNILIICFSFSCNSCALPRGCRRWCPDQRMQVRKGWHCRQTDLYSRCRRQMVWHACKVAPCPTGATADATGQCKCTKVGTAGLLAWNYATATWSGACAGIVLIQILSLS